jgi:hypothetical protein
MGAAVSVVTFATPASGEVPFGKRFMEVQSKRQGAGRRNKTSRRVDRWFLSPADAFTERDSAPSAVVTKSTVSSTSGYSKPPWAAQIPFETCTSRIAVIITAPRRTVSTGVRSPPASEKPPTSEDVRIVVEFRGGPDCAICD